jgi:hypothetical protein
MRVLRRPAIPIFCVFVLAGVVTWLVDITRASEEIAVAAVVVIALAAGFAAANAAMHD